MEQVLSTRNGVVHDNGMICTNMLITGIRNRNAEHWASQFSQHVDTISQTQPRWSKPREGWIKINCDATLGLKLSSLAVVARDWRGMGVLAISRKANTSNLSKLRLKPFYGQLNWLLIKVGTEFALRAIPRSTLMRFKVIFLTLLGGFRAVSLICILFFLLTPFGPLVGLRGKQLLLLIILLNGLLGSVHGGFFIVNIVQIVL